MTANDLGLGVPARPETIKKTGKTSALPSFAAFIGADPWSPRRVIGIILATRIAVALSQWGLGGLRPLDWLSPVFLLSGLLTLAVRVVVVAAVFQLTKREMTAAIVVGLASGFLSFLIYDSFDYDPGAARLKAAAIAFLYGAAWILITGHALRRFRNVFVALFAAEVGQRLLIILVMCATYGMNAIEGAFEIRLYFAAFVTATLLSLAVRLTRPREIADTDAPPFGVPSR